jgi:stearoyl-CoA desaturase (delta-9 desaturase)
MSNLVRNINLGAAILPFVGFLAAIALLWNDLVGPTELAIMAGMYLLTGLGITVGFHRHLTHNAFASPAPVRYAIAVLGSMAVQGPVINWVADHRKHHAFTDRDGDPHSPHGHGEGWRAALAGLWHAHMGWLFEEVGQADKRRYAADLLEDRGMRLIDRWFLPIVGLSLAVPFAIGLAIGGTLEAGLLALLWGGLVRVFLLHHVTWSINSICHFFGRRRFETEDQSRNVFWLAPFSFGESWHHNHHAFPRSAHHGLRPWELDVGGMVISGMERVGLARDVVRISPERQRQKLAEPS